MNPTVKESASLNSILELIGKKLLTLRIKKGYSSHADFAKEYGLPRIQYWRMEKGKANITLKSLSKVLAIHGLKLEDLFMQLSKDNRKRKRAEQ